MTAPTGFTCAADECDVTVVRPTLMCDEHWGMVPAALQTSLTATYRPGQEVDGTASSEHVAYLKAARAEIVHKQRRQRRGPSKPVQLPLFELHRPARRSR